MHILKTTYDPAYMNLYRANIKLDLSWNVLLIDMFMMVFDALSIHPLTKPMMIQSPRGPVGLSLANRMIPVKHNSSKTKYGKITAFHPNLSNILPQMIANTIADTP